MATGSVGLSTLLQWLYIALHNANQQFCYVHCHFVAAHSLSVKRAVTLSVSS